MKMSKDFKIGNSYCEDKSNNFDMSSSSSLGRQLDKYPEQESAKEHGHISENVFGQHELIEPSADTKDEVSHNYAYHNFEDTKGIFRDGHVEKFCSIAPVGCEPLSRYVNLQNKNLKCMVVTIGTGFSQTSDHMTEPLLSNDGFTEENDGIIEEHNGITNKHDDVAEENEGIIIEHDGNTKELDDVAEENEGIIIEHDGNTKELDDVAEENEGIIIEHDGNTKELDSVSDEPTSTVCTFNDLLDNLDSENETFLSFTERQAREVEPKFVRNDVYTNIHGDDNLIFKVHPIDWTGNDTLLYKDTITLTNFEVHMPREEMQSIKKSLKLACNYPMNLKVEFNNCAIILIGDCLTKNVEQESERNCCIEGDNGLIFSEGTLFPIHSSSVFHSTDQINKRNIVIANTLTEPQKYLRTQHRDKQSKNKPCVVSALQYKIALVPTFRNGEDNVLYVPNVVYVLNISKKDSKYVVSKENYNMEIIKKYLVKNKHAIATRTHDDKLREQGIQKQLSRLGQLQYNVENGQTKPNVNWKHPAMYKILQINVTRKIVQDKKSDFESTSRYVDRVQRDLGTIINCNIKQAQFSNIYNDKEIPEKSFVTNLDKKVQSCDETSEKLGKLLQDEPADFSTIEKLSSTDFFQKNTIDMLQHEISQFSGSAEHRSIKNWTRESHERFGVKLRNTRNSNFTKQFQQIFKDLEGQNFVRSLVREIHPYIGRVDVYVLERYFNMLGSGPPPTREEQMSFEWLRLASFSTYHGNGNALALARNGFYHDNSQGPHATRCIHCGVTHNTWELFDNVIVEHQRISPRCPVFMSSTDLTNIGIDNSHAQSIPRTTASSVSTSSMTVDTFEHTASVDDHQSLGLPALSSTSASMNASGNTDDHPHVSLQSSSMIQHARLQGATSGNDIQSQPSVQHPSEDQVNPVMPSDIQTTYVPAFGFTGTRYISNIAHRENNVAGGARTNTNVTTSIASSTTHQIPAVPLSTMNALDLQVVPAGAFSMQTFSHAEATNATLNESNVSLGPGSRMADPTAGVVVSNPKHPDYLTLESRTSSYRAWPAYLDQTPRQMAEAGFFFVGVSDFTRCFACGGGLRNWEPGDDPVLEHTRWFPRCEYINKLKGERYVQAVERRHREHMAERQRQQNEIAQRRAAMQTATDPLSTSAAVVLGEMGYTVEKIREAVNAVRLQTGLRDVSAEQAVTWIFDNAERQSETVQQVPTIEPSVSASSSVASSGNQQVSMPATVSSGSPSPSSSSTVNSANQLLTSKTGVNQVTGVSTSGSASSVVKPGSKNDATDKNQSESKEGSKKQGKKKKRDSSSQKIPGAAGGESDIDMKSLQQENERLREMQTCKICMENSVNTTLMPCGHLVTCEPCAKRLAKCPICRKIIKGSVKTFML